MPLVYKVGFVQPQVGLEIQVSVNLFQESLLVADHVRAGHGFLFPRCLL